MTPFTDEDLKTLKEDCENQKQSIQWTIPMLVALLARLEAAEDHCKFHHCHCEGCDYSYLGWRKAKGIDPDSLSEWDRKAAGK